MNCFDCQATCPTAPPRFRWPWQVPSRVPPLAIAGTVALVGSPNVGKSLLFDRLCGGARTTVSNYPGTTVELVQGTLPLNQTAGLTVIDTPGLYSLLPITEEERVARDFLLETSLDLVLHVIDAKQLSRMLVLTLQLIEAELPVLLVLNMIDEATALGLEFDLPALKYSLQIPVVTVSAARGTGLAHLIQEVSSHVPSVLASH